MAGRDFALRAFFRFPPKRHLHSNFHLSLRRCWYWCCSCWCRCYCCFFCNQHTIWQV